MSFQFPSVADYLTRYRQRTADPATVAERTLEAAQRLARHDPPLPTFIALDPEDVRRQAEASTKRWRAGTPLGPLDGVPIAIKDQFDVAGYPTTCGTRTSAPPANEDALAVARLRAAGAILFGKTHMTELGMFPSGMNPWYGAARNPYDPTRETGGSSSGSAAAVAMGLLPLSLGSDSGGSVRVPAALTGVVGLKPTFDRVPTCGMAPLGWSLGHAGPIGATVADVVTGLAVLSGAPLTLPELPRPLRIGVCPRLWQGANEEVATLARAAVDRAADGHTIEIDLDHAELASAVLTATMTVEIAAARPPSEPLGAATQISLEIGRGTDAVTYVKAQRARALIARDFEWAWESVDVMVLPTTAITAPSYPRFPVEEIDEAKAHQLAGLCFAPSLTGMPAVSVPCGYDSQGLPVGLQIIAPWGEDLRALALAAAIEAATERRRPQVWHSPL